MILLVLTDIRLQQFSLAPRIDAVCTSRQPWKLKYALVQDTAGGKVQDVARGSGVLDLFGGDKTGQSPASKAEELVDEAKKPNPASGFIGNLLGIDAPKVSAVLIYPNAQFPIYMHIAVNAFCDLQDVCNGLHKLFCASNLAKYCQDINICLLAAQSHCHKLEMLLAHRSNSLAG